MLPRQVAFVKTENPAMIAIIAAALIVPAPIHAIAFLGKPLPASDSTRKPARAMQGLMQAGYS